MSYRPSINIEYEVGADFKYIITPNAQSVLGNIVANYQTGSHSFTIIGTYGTGKSSFILALERDLKNRGGKLVQNHQVFGSDKFEFLNIVGDYASLSTLLARKLNCDSQNVFSVLNHKVQALKKGGKFLFLVIDEFGKVLEHAANNNPEQELYFLQKLAEFVNVPSREVILITTLHQNFNTYAYKLTDAQRNEWNKVKGRFKEVVFVEPVEQLLYLASQQLGQEAKSKNDDISSINDIVELAKSYHIISREVKLKTIQDLYPLDAISSACLTLGIQRYGQNERTLFSFLTSIDDHSIKAFKPQHNLTYNVACVYDYLAYSFYSALAETNADSMDWRSMRVAIERVESGVIENSLVDGCLKIVKTIGLLNLFFKQITIDDRLLSEYSRLALGITDAKPYLSKLLSLKIIRFAAYKSQYILFEGTDVDIEAELYKAATVVPIPAITVSEILPYVNQKAELASAVYYKRGTPRYFECKVENDAVESIPNGDIDGYINLVFPLSITLDDVIDFSSKVESANIFVYFNNVEELTTHLHEIKKLQYLLDNVIIEDRVAKREVVAQMQHEIKVLNDCVNGDLTQSNGCVTWIYKGKAIEIRNHKDINSLLSMVCEEVYYRTPIIQNELLNRQKLSSAISLARISLLDAMIQHSAEKDFGFGENAFPPEKTIYYTIFRNTGIHRQDSDGHYILDEPTAEGIMPLWAACCDFLSDSIEKEQKLTTLIKTLKERPFKLKQGLIDFWVPIFLFTKQQTFALYNGSTFVLDINKEVLELIQKRPGDFSIRAYDVQGVKLQFFRKYRQFLRQTDELSVTSSSVLGTIKPFFSFYRHLNTYAKTTRKFSNSYTAKFRDILAEAKDPAKAFFEDLPKAFGYTELDKDEFVENYVDLIRSAVQELNLCYDNFIERIERCVKQHLGIAEETEFTAYKPMLEAKYHSIRTDLLAQKPRVFVERLLSPSGSRREFFEKIGQVVYDRKIETIKDSEEERFIYDLLYLFSETSRYVSVSNIISSSVETAFNFEMLSSENGFKVAQTFALPKSKRDEAHKMGQQVSNLLSGDKELDVCVLLKLLSERL